LKRILKYYCTVETFQNSKRMEQKGVDGLLKPTVVC